MSAPSATLSLTAKQATVRNTETFQAALANLNDAAVGIIMCRTREPLRAVDAIRELATSQKRDFKYWTCNRGWASHDPARPDAPAATDNVRDPILALCAIEGTAPATNEPFPAGYYAMVHPHFWISGSQPSPVLLATLKEYADTFSGGYKRLILVVPQGVSLPREIEGDVVILDFDLPTYAERFDAYEEIMDGLASRRPRMDRPGVDRILAAGAGMSRDEFVTALSRALVANRASLPNVGADVLVAGVMRSKVETVKKSNCLEVMTTEDAANVGGLGNLKRWLEKRARCFSDEARAAGVDTPKGVLLVGPPGTGKSLFGKVTGSTLGLPVIKFDLSRVFAGLVGESEKNVDAALKMLDAMAPCVVFVDEIDKVFQTGASGDSGVSQKVLGKVLTHLQESEAPLFWIMSANRVENLPAELMRKGRMDEVFSVSLPDPEEALEIARIHLRKRGRNPDDVVGLEAIMDASRGYVPAEIEAAVKEALIEVFAEGAELTGDLIVTQLSYMKPLSEAHAVQFTAMREWAENNARPASGNVSPIARRVPETRGGVAPPLGSTRRRVLTSGPDTKN
jgi:hypothetical protein